ncbi:MAG: glycine cleavage system aminomethyltransferase GcvT [Evtepia sp.]
MELKTPLYDVHVEEGGKIVPFAGYLLPVQYGTGVIKEHMAVRQQCGLFDVSHMGEILFTGPTALATLNHLLTNDYSNMPINKVRYGVMCNEQGGTIDDLVVYKFGEESYLVVVNAANRAKDYAHMAANTLEGTKCEDISDTVAQVALQGPKAPAIMKKLLPEDQIPKGYYTALPNVNLGGMNCMISRTGYTGELGYEIYTASENAPKLWKLLREAGEEFGLIPCGLGARDTLRLEAAMPLYGHEMDETITPLEAGLDFGVKLNKEEFIGHDALVAAGAPKRVRVGLEVTGRGIIREHQDVYIGDEKIGVSTSGTHCPYLGKAIAMALVDANHAEVGTKVEAEVRGRRVAAEIIPLPFYTRGK